MPEINNLTDLTLEELKASKKKLLERKDFYQDLYDKIKTSIEDAEFHAQKTKDFLPREEYKRMQSKKREHYKNLLAIQTQLGAHTSEIRKREHGVFDKLFVEVCREKLSPDKFEEIFNIVRTKMLNN